jgi:hypothetical protein
MKNRTVVLLVVLTAALMLSLVAPASVAGADEDCYANKAPEIIAPSDGTVIASDPNPSEGGGNVPFAIRWERLCDASRYDIQFALDEDFDSIVGDASETNYLPPETDTPSYLVPAGALACEASYYWRVRAVKTGTGQVIQGLWSEPRRVTVAAEPGGGVYLVAPEVGAMNVSVANVAFAWGSEATFDEYDLVLSPYADLSAPVLDAAGLTSETYTFTGTLAYATAYYWQVTAYRDGSMMSASAIGTFITMAEGLRSLTVSSTAGGSVTTPGEETYVYEFGNVINLVAEPEDGYRFVRWTGDVCTVGDVNAASTNVTVQDNFLITANFATPPIEYNLSIASTAGGSVTTPGEGTPSYEEGTVVNLVAKPEDGYRFVRWTGDVSTVGNVSAESTTISTDGDYSITAHFEPRWQNVQVGIKAGDWIKLEYEIIGWPTDIVRPEWVQLEFLSVEGTIANVRTTTHWSDDGIGGSDTVPVDLRMGGSEILGHAGSVISANSTAGDSVYITGFGEVVIEGETTRTYAGAHRTVVYASISQDEVQYSYHWDKLTGVMVEASVLTATIRATETNMWTATGIGTPWWLWVIIAIVIAGVAVAVYRLKKRKTPTTTALPPEG